MTPNKLPPLPEPVLDVSTHQWADAMPVVRNEIPAEQYFTADQMHAYAADALRQSQSLPAGAVAYDRELIASMLDSAANGRTGYKATSMREQAELLRAADNADADGVNTAALQADAREKGEAVCFGLRRKGETAIIGVIPHKVHAVKATSEEFLSGYEEVPLYARPEQAATGDEAMAMHWIDRYAACIDEEPQMDRIREALATQPAQASEKDNG